MLVASGQEVYQGGAEEVAAIGAKAAEAAAQGEVDADLQAGVDAGLMAQVLGLGGSLAGLAEEVKGLRGKVEEGKSRQAALDQALADAEARATAYMKALEMRDVETRVQREKELAELEAKLQVKLQVKLGEEAVQRDAALGMVQAGLLDKVGLVEGALKHFKSDVEGSVDLLMADRDAGRGKAPAVGIMAASPAVAHSTKKRGRDLDTWLDVGEVSGSEVKLVKTAPGVGAVKRRVAVTPMAVTPMAVTPIEKKVAAINSFMEKLFA